MPEKTLNDIPRDLRVMFTKGNDALSRDNFDYAIDLFCQVLAREPGLVECRRALRSAQQHKSGGGGFFKKTWSSASSSPQVAKAQMTLRKDPAEALVIAEQVLNGDPNNSIAHRIVAAAATALALPQTAVMSLEIIHQHSPKDKKLAIEFANTLADAGEVRRAEKILMEFARSAPTDGELSQALKDLSAKRTLPEGFHPKFTSPLTGTAEFRFDISFVGSRRTARAIFFRQLRELGVLIKPFGSGWPDRESVKNPEAVYRTGAMHLGIGFTAPSPKPTTLKARDFECPGAGACCLTTYNWELALHYELGREIPRYRGLEELVEMYSFYRKRLEECLKIAPAAFRRCNAEHTWEKRFRKVFRAVGFNT